MAVDWYYRDGDRTLGPFTAEQIRAQVKHGRIHAETQLRKGTQGRWVQADQVKGLLGSTGRQPNGGPVVATPASASESTSNKIAAKPSRSKPDGAGPTAAAASGADDGGTYLAPLRDRRRRSILFGCVVVVILLGSVPWHQKLFGIVMAGLFCGSYPVVLVKRSVIEQTIWVGFLPVHRQTWKLRDFVSVMGDVERRIEHSLGILVLLLPYWLLFRLLDFIVPWLGGDYKVYLKGYDEEKTQIWQGNNTAHFEANLALLAEHGLTIE